MYFPTEINKKTGIVFDVKKPVPKHHVNATNHHVFTIKKPPPNTRFSKTPFKNASKNNKTPGLPGAGIFSEFTKAEPPGYPPV